MLEKEFYFNIDPRESYFLFFIIPFSPSFVHPILSSSCLVVSCVFLFHLHSFLLLLSPLLPLVLTPFSPLSSSSPSSSLLPLLLSPLLPPLRTAWYRIDLDLYCSSSIGPLTCSPHSCTPPPTRYVRTRTAQIHSTLFLPLLLFLLDIFQRGLL